MRAGIWAAVRSHHLASDATHSRGLVENR